MKNQRVFLPLILLPVLALSACRDPGTTSAVAPPTSELPTSSVVPPVATVMTLPQIREARVGAFVEITGVVAKHVYTGQQTPYITGFLLASETGTIYIYGEDTAKSVEVGQKLTVQGTKAYYIPQTDTGAAEAVGYKGQLQLTSPTVTNTAAGTFEIPGGAITSVDKLDPLIKAPLDIDISNSLYRIKGRITTNGNDEYTNYYLCDLDRVHSMRFYTQSNGKDFAWLTEYVGKSIDIIFSVLNSKPGERMWRGLPIEVIGEVSVTDEQEAQYAAYRGIDDLLEKYTSATSVALPADDDEVLEGITYAYSVSSNAFASIAVDETTGVNSLVITDPTDSVQVTLTCTATYRGKTASYDRVITLAPPSQYDTITIAKARGEADGTIVTVKAVVGRVTIKSKQPQGLFIFDETGSMFAYNGADTMPNIAAVTEGNTVTLRGKVTHYLDPKIADTGFTGNFQLADVEVLENDGGNTAFPTASITEMTVAEISANPATNNITGTVFKVRGKVIKKDGQYPSYSFGDETVTISLYSQSSGAEYGWLDPYKDQEALFYIGVQNLQMRSGNPNWRCCPIAFIELI